MVRHFSLLEIDFNFVFAFFSCRQQFQSRCSCSCESDWTEECSIYEWYAISRCLKSISILFLLSFLAGNNSSQVARAHVNQTGQKSAQSMNGTPFLVA